MDAEMMRVSELVSKRLAEYLSRHPLGRASLKVLPDEIYMRNDWWRVPVVATGELPRQSDYYEALAEVEEDLDAEDGENILLEPYYPDDPSSASVNGAVVN